MYCSETEIWTEFVCLGSLTTKLVRRVGTMRWRVWEWPGGVEEEWAVVVKGDYSGSENEDDDVGDLDPTAELDFGGDGKDKRRRPSTGGKGSRHHDDNNSTTPRRNQQQLQQPLPSAFTPTNVKAIADIVIASQAAYASTLDKMLALQTKTMEAQTSTAAALQAASVSNPRFDFEALAKMQKLWGPTAPRATAPTKDDK
jgi:hypothetical protein